MALVVKIIFAAFINHTHNRPASPVHPVRAGSPGYPVGAKVIKEAGEVADMTIIIGK